MGSRLAESGSNSNPDGSMKVISWYWLIWHDICTQNLSFVVGKSIISQFHIFLDLIFGEFLPDTGGFSNPMDQ